MNKFLANVATGAIFLTLLTPLVVASSMFFPFITGKAFFFRTIVEVAFTAWLVLAWRNPDYRPRRGLILWSFLTLVVAATLATVFSADVTKSIWSNFERMEGLITYLHLFGYFLVLAGLFQTKQIWHRFFATSVGVSAAVSFYALTQFLGWAEIHQSGVRLDATLGNATYLAVFLLFNIFLAAFLWFQTETTKSGKWFYGVSIILNIFVLYNTATRGSILGLLAGVGAVALLTALVKRGRARQIGLGLLLGLALLAGGFWLARDSQIIQSSPVLSRFAGISLDDTTTQSRFLIWQMALKGVAERPILGWGPDNFQLVFSRHYDPQMCRQEPWFDRAHNVFVDWLVTTGVVGFLAYLALFVTGAYLLIRLALAHRSDSNNGLIILVGLLAAYGVNNLFVFDNLVSYLLFVATLAYIHFLTSEAKPVIISHEFGRTSIKIAAGVTIIAVLAVFYLTVIQPARTSATLIKAISPIDASVPADQQTVYRAETFDRVLALSPTGRVEAREQLLQATLQIVGSDASDQNKQAIVNFAGTEIIKSVEQNEYDARPPYLAGRFLGALGDYNNATQLLIEALRRSPGKQMIMFDLANVYFQTERSTEGATLIQDAYELDLTCPDSAVNYAMVKLSTGDRATARQILLDSFGTTSIDHERLKTFYQQQGVEPL